jgi:hypothetical protein
MFNFLSRFDEISASVSSGTELSTPRFHALALDWYLLITSS